jgi:asparagine N-glycosylation enzyme membrane subunit Stt3
MIRRIDAGVMTGRILHRWTGGKRMLWNLGTGWLVLAATAVAILSFIVATVLNALLGEEGFGATGNASIITFGFFGGIWLANTLGHHLADVQRAIATGLGGAFLLLTVLVVLKAAMRRLSG